MQYVLKNDELTVTVDSLGAELTSVKRGEVEYLWQGDARYWAAHAPTLFPICGRVFDGKYTYGGKLYELGAHGFAAACEFEAERVTPDTVSLVLRSNPDLMRQYPFDFLLRIVFCLRGALLSVNVDIENRGDVLMPASFGAHPGFAVPLGGSSDFSDWYLQFEQPCSPDEILLDGSYASGKKRGMVLVDSVRLPLSHALFDLEGVFMHRVCDTVTLACDKSPRFVKLHYPDMPYLGIWQPARTNAPFLCIEPWCGFADYAGCVGDLAQKPDMFRIPPHASHPLSYSILFG